MRTALDMYTQRYADQLPPKAQQILAQLSDNVVELAFDAIYGADDEMLESFPANDEDRPGYWARRGARARGQLRYDVPALQALSDADLDVVISVALAAAIDPDLDEPVSQHERRRVRSYNALVEVYAYGSVYELCVETDPSTPVSHVIPLFELEQRSIDPATPYGEIFPPNVVAQGFKDAWNRFINSWRALDQWSSKMVWHRQRSEQPLKNDFNRRQIKIIRNMLSASKQAVDRKKMGDEEYQKFAAWWPKMGIDGWIDLMHQPHRRSHIDRVPLATKQILARLPDAKLAVRLVRAYLFAPARAPEPTQTTPARQDGTPIRLIFIAEQLKRIDQPDVWAEIRRDVPALKALSDEELNVACNVAFAFEEMDDDEYFYFVEMFRMPPGK